MEDQFETLILGIGNILMGDEGIGVYVLREIEKTSFPPGIECLDGGTGGFVLLDPMQNANKLIIIDATLDGNKPGTISKLKPKYSSDYPKTLTAHDIGLKDLIDAYYLMGKEEPDVTLFTVSITPLSEEPTMDMSPEVSAIIPALSQQIIEYVRQL